jgi:hypothetical protein
MVCPFVGKEAWMVKRLRRAFKKMSKKPAKQRRRPLTTLILMSIPEAPGVLDLTLHDIRCMWAAMVIAVFALLRAGEFLSKERKKLLTHGDFRRMNEQRSKARLTLHNTKSMLWKDDVYAYLFENESKACPTTVMQELLDNYPPHLKSGKGDPLFTLSSGKVLTRDVWVPWARDVMSAIGLKGEDFDGISPRKGGAESLRLVDAPNDVVRKMGRWADSSFVFETYQAISSKEMATYASRMAALSRESLIAQGKGKLLDGEFDSTGIFVEEDVQKFVGEHKQTWRLVPAPSEKGKRNLTFSLKKV